MPAWSVQAASTERLPVARRVGGIQGVIELDSFWQHQRTPLSDVQRSSVRQLFATHSPPHNIYILPSGVNLQALASHYPFSTRTMNRLNIGHTLLGEQGLTVGGFLFDSWRRRAVVTRSYGHMRTAIWQGPPDTSEFGRLPLFGVGEFGERKQRPMPLGLWISSPPRCRSYGILWMSHPPTTSFVSTSMR